MKPILAILLLFVATAIQSQIPFSDKPYIASNYEDLNFLKEQIGDKTIVCLGEEWHFTETFSQVKNRLVKYLHEEMGFNFVVFESAFQGAWLAEQQELVAKERLLETLPTIWRTESVLDLMKYMDASQSSAQPMLQYGIDLNGVYTERFKAALKAYAEERAPELLPELLRVETLVQDIWLAQHRRKSNDNSKLNADDVKVYSELLSTIEKDDVSFENELDRSNMSRAVWNRIALAKKLLSKDMFFREKIMT